MKTAIKSLKIIKEMYEYFVKKYRVLEPNLMICEKEDFDNVEKHLKVLETILNKGVDIDSLFILNCEQYNEYCKTIRGGKTLTKHEYNSIKELLDEKSVV